MRTGITFILLLLISSLSFGQEGTAETENVAVPEPFNGTVTYSIFWQGPNTALWGDHLPDSMEITTSGGNLQVKVFGGNASQLIQEYLWFQENGQFYLVDHKNQVLYTDPQGTAPVKLKKQPLSSKEDQEILGHACKAYRFSGNGNPDTYWLAADLPLAIGEVPDSVYQPPFIDPDLKLLPLQMVRNVNGVKSTTVATQVTPGAPIISLPMGYTEKSFFKHVARHPYLPKSERE